MTIVPDRPTEWCPSADFYFVETDGGEYERTLLQDLLRYYNSLERPVFNESDAVELQLGLTLQQIIDVVRLSLHSIFTATNN